MVEILIAGSTVALGGTGLVGWLFKWLFTEVSSLRTKNAKLEQRMAHVEGDMATLKDTVDSMFGYMKDTSERHTQILEKINSGQARNVENTIHLSARLANLEKQ